MNLFAFSKAFTCGAILAGFFAFPALALEPKQCLSLADMNKAMQAEGQRSLVVGNRSAMHNDASAQSGVSVSLYVNLFTSNSDGSLGYNLEGDKPMGTPSEKVCVRSKFINIALFDARKSGTPPAAKRGGEFDKSLQRNELLGTRPMLQADAIATAPDGTVHKGNGLTLFGNAKIKSAYVVVNYPDNTAADLFLMTETDYTPEGLARFVAKATKKN